MFLIKNIFYQILPSAILALIGIKFFAEELNTFNFLIALLIVVVILIAYKIIKAIVKIISYQINEQQMMQNMFLHLKNNNFPKPSQYLINSKETIAGELYFREVSLDEAQSLEVRNIANEYRTTVETLRSISSFVNLFIFLNLYKKAIYLLEEK